MGEGGRREEGTRAESACVSQPSPATLFLSPFPFQTRPTYALLTWGQSMLRSSALTSEAARREGEECAGARGAGGPGRVAGARLRAVKAAGALGERGRVERRARRGPWWWREAMAGRVGWVGRARRDSRVESESGGSRERFFRRCSFFFSLRRAPRSARACRGFPILTAQVTAPPHPRPSADPRGVSPRALFFSLTRIRKKNERRRPALRLRLGPPTRPQRPAHRALQPGQAD